ncbi:NADPH oxidase 5 [Anser cygnoides]|uniref:NADPH oxidase 5 n=1 Tax=Anser cygnoides TaxID=8845 RepID=UPI0034D265A2
MSAGEDAAWLRWVAKQFESIAGADRQIDLEEFKAALKVKESFFAERLFALFDSDGSGTISLEELLSALSLLVHGSETDKLRFLFRVYDVDGSGAIDLAELRLVLQACLRESAVSLPPPRLDDLALALFEAADKDGSGSITFEELRAELEAFPGVMENLTISAVSWLKPPPPPERSRRPRCLTTAYWHNHGSQLAFLGGYASLNLLLFALAALRHAGLGGWVAVARGCGQCLNFNCAFIAVLMLRRCLTWLRATPAAQVLPLDQSVGLHQLVGYVVLALAALHTGAHVANLSRLAQQDGHRALAEFLLRPRPDGGGLGGTASQTGLALQGLLAAMLAFSSPCVRRGGHFEVFYWSHLSYVSVWALLVLHAPNFWKWFVVPGGLFVLEKAVGLATSRAVGLRIVEVNLLPSKVTHLVVQRPRSFRFRPGDYVYLNVPAIAAYEWHPFTISSAPEQRDTIWLHVRARGQWTSQLHEYFRHPEAPRLSGNLGEARWWRRAQVGEDGALLPAEMPVRARSPASAQPRIWCGRQAQQAEHLVPRASHSLFLFFFLPSPFSFLCFPFPFPLAVASQTRLCTRSGSSGGSVATTGDEAVELTSYRAPGAPAAPQGRTDEDPSPEEVSMGPGESRRLCSIKCYIDGPYGTPTRRIFTSEHAVLIGAGIGITPFASILQSIMHRYRLRKQSHDYKQRETLRDEDMALRKVDFIWINRDQKHFEWFVSLLAKLELEQAEQEPGGRFLELHLYLTAALGKSDVRAVGLQLALDLLAAKEHKDSITGLRTRTQPGRPDWSKVFRKVAEERKGKVQVFFCGSPALAKVVKAHCERFGFRFFKENF